VRRTETQGPNDYTIPTIYSRGDTLPDKVDAERLARMFDTIGRTETRIERSVVLTALPVGRDPDGSRADEAARLMRDAGKKRGAVRSAPSP
jgi:hypothetical protein